MSCEVEKRFPILFRGKALGDYRPDLIVNNYVVVEIKSVERYDPVFLAQMLTYLRVTQLRVGLILNFNRVRLVDGSKQVVLYISLKTYLCASAPLWLPPAWGRRTA